MIERDEHRTPDSDETGQAGRAASLLTAREAASVLGVNERTVRRAIARGDIRAAKRSGVFRIAPDDLAGFRPRTNGDGARQPARHLPLRLLRTSPAAPPHHVPEPRMSPIGREHDIQAILALLASSDVPLTTLTGPGGVGKTRLALAVAARLRGLYRDGVWFVDLSPLRDPKLVMATIAGVLGIREVAGVAAPERLRAYLEGRQTLILLDNVEQVVAATTGIATLLAACPELTMLATSRVPLHLADEHRYPVAPLAVPEATHATSLATIETAAAVQLFCRKARAVQPDFELTGANAHAVSDVCVRLDGLPLAIELAAARANVLPPQALLARLERRLPLLTGGATDQPLRLRSMRDAVGWSYDLLDEVGQRLFRRLAVFTGGFTEAAASHVVGPEGLTPMLDRLAALAEHSLIITRDAGGQELRFAMLETIREFGLDQLEDSGELDTTRDRHAASMLSLVLQAAPYWFTAHQKRWSDQMDGEHDNLRAALAWLAKRGDRRDVARLAGGVWPFWFVRNHYAEGVAWLRQALAGSDGERTHERLRVLTGAGCLWLMRGNEPGARAFNEEAWRIAQALDNLSHIEFPYIGLAVCAYARGDYDEGNRWNEEALAAFRALGDTTPNALPLASVILCNMGLVAFDVGEPARAKTLAEEALAMQRALGFTWAASDSLLLLARIAEAAGEASRASALYRESLQLAADHVDMQQIVDHFDHYPAIDRGTGNIERAVMLLGAGNSIHELIGDQPGPDRQAQLDQVARDAEARLGEAEFTETWQAGYLLSLDDAIAIGLEVEVPPQLRTTPGFAAQVGVTRRELDVLCLVAEGQTDQEIADALFISRRTVNTHVSRVLSKLGASSRREAVRLARGHDLLVDCAVDGQHPIP